MKPGTRWCFVASAIAACTASGNPPPETTSPGTAAVSTVVPSENDARVTRVEDLLRGVPGLEVTRMSNGNYQLRIRGPRSIRGNPTDDNPLVVIDGVPISNESIGSALADLSPRDVARIEVLKDAGATSMYGSRGANGVIVITTKRAR
jgi:TonB-dependent SusC/RagA subfamily outer membrane receptor